MSFPPFVCIGTHERDDELLLLSFTSHIYSDPTGVGSFFLEHIAWKIHEASVDCANNHSMFILNMYLANIQGCIGICNTDRVPQCVHAHDSTEESPTGHNQVRCTAWNEHLHTKISQLYDERTNKLSIRDGSIRSRLVRFESVLNNVLLGLEMFQQPNLCCCMQELFPAKYF